MMFSFGWHIQCVCGYGCAAPESSFDVWTDTGHSWVTNYTEYFCPECGRLLWTGFSKPETRKVS